MPTRIAVVFALALSCAAVALPSAAFAQPNHVIGRASIVDGDTIEVQGQRIRLTGIDAPESSQTCTDAKGEDWACGRRAAFALADLVGAAPVECEEIDRDRWRRMVAICVKPDGTDLSRWMVEQGLAIAFRRYSLAYVGEENDARSAKRGVWAGDFLDPSDYRRLKASR
jgi:endonuclease YncB( thermonuclease family)